MQSQSQLLDDLARMISGAVSAATGLRGDMQNRLREQLERVLTPLDLVTREEFEVVKALAATARHEQEALSRKVEELETKLAARS